VIGLRNILVYAYFRVDPDEIWGVVDRDIPALREEIVTLRTRRRGECRGGPFLERRRLTGLMGGW